MQRRENKNIEHVRVSVRAAMFKFYPEMIYGWTDEDKDSLERHKELLTQFMYNLCNDENCPYWFHAIIHDSDYCVPELHKPKTLKPEVLKKMTPQERDIYNHKLEEQRQQYITKVIHYFWNPQLEKIHLHIEVLTKTGKATDIQVILNYFRKMGLRLREDADTIGLRSGWIQKLDKQKKAHIKMMVYHTHETDEAKADGKHEYSREEVFTNIDFSTLSEWYQIYDSVLSHKHENDGFEVKNLARDAGRHIMKYRQTFLDFWHSEKVPYCIGIQSKYRNYAKEEFDIGVSEFMESKESLDRVRCSIFINGDGMTGKTFTSELALKVLGFKVISVGCGSGKFDNVRPSHDGLVISDKSLPDPFDVADNKPVFLHRRNSGDPLFLGQWVIITYNGTFWQYVDSVYSKASWYGNPHAMDALHSRFYCLDVNNFQNRQLWLNPDRNHKNPVTGSLEWRGNQETVQIRHTMLKEFMDTYNSLILNYNPELQDNSNLPAMLSGFYGAVPNTVQGKILPPSAFGLSVPIIPKPYLVHSLPVSTSVPAPASSAIGDFLNDFIQLPC